MFVYLITNTVSGKRYVGQTVRPLSRRWSAHCSNSGCLALRNAIRKYRPENFVIESICEVPTRELADEFEKEYIERYCTMSPNGYNLKTGGGVPVYSEESRAKMSASSKGRISPRKGVVLSEETKKRISEAKKGISLNPEGVLKRAKAQTGLLRSNETKERIRASVKLSWAQRRKLNVD